MEVATYASPICQVGNVQTVPSAVGLICRKEVRAYRRGVSNAAAFEGRRDTHVCMGILACERTLASH